MFSKLKQIRDLRQQAKSIEKTMADVMAPGAAVSGKVKLVLDGNQKLLQVDIDPSLLAPNEKERLEDGLKKAYDDAIGNLRKQLQEKMRAGELEMPDLDALKKS